MALPNIYLDHAATTPMLPAARDAWLEGAGIWANPSSPHAAGRAARAALEEARARVKAALDWQGEVIFTSGASEALAIGLGRAKPARRLVSAVEHDAVFRAAPGAGVLPVGENWEIDRDVLAGRLGEGRAAVAIQHVNSETGVIQPVSDYAAMVREAGGLLLSDCSQSAGKFRLPDADMIVLSAHKLGGPVGIGALLVRDFAMLEPTGGQERGYRAGTENLPSVLGFAAALEARRISDRTIGEGMNTAAIAGWADWVAMAGLAFCDIEYEINRFGGVFQCAAPSWDPSILSITMPGVSAAAQLIQFDSAGFAVSAGSACSSGTLKQSRTLMAFGVPEQEARNTIRMSAGWCSSYDDIMAFARAWSTIAARAGTRA
ncbi:cysteine desulfurase family protein [Novosphingobium resinovorum]|uniref:cysteine desulfurase family protein n=1 Tax=Novosphingobium resinovorum TaxID=158500 RepID=UPI002ED69DF8|nr:aminotransferase class V-fold PLP-dependent enzyme [Novosphingobium resinovorum]